VKWGKGIENMIRITFINGSYCCESGITKLKLKRDSFDRIIGVTRKTTRRRLRAHEIATLTLTDLSYVKPSQNTFNGLQKKYKYSEAEQP